MGAKGWLDRVFRGDAVSEAAYAEPEQEEIADEPALDGTYDRRPAGVRAPRRDNVVEFPRAGAGNTGGFARESTREPAGFTREFRESGGGGFGSGSGGGFSGGGQGSFSTGDAGDAYVVFKRLKDFQMATQVADRMVENKIVILNLESCDDEVARRVLDFIGGVAYACNGMVKRIAGRVFMITPKGISSDGEFFDEVKGSVEGIYDE